MSKAQNYVLELPASLVGLWDSVRAKDESLEESLKQEMVLALVRRHKISARRGAELLEMDYQDFLDLMAENEISLFDYEPDELKGDVQNLERIPQ